MSEPISSLPLFAPQPDLSDLADLWPTLDAAIQVQCSVCADMGSRIVWAENGTYAVEPCPVCGAGEEPCVA